MDITKKNFESTFPLVEKAIQDAEFLSIDGEFSGLTNGVSFNAFDTPEECYQKLFDGQMDYLLMQLGLCAFKFNEEAKRYEYQAFNFFIFPTPINSSAPDCRFICQSSSISFLSSTGFDFNKVFSQGISYLNVADEEEFRKTAELKRQYSSRNSITESPKDTPEDIPIPPDELTNVTEVCAKIGKFLNDDEGNTELKIDGSYSPFTRKLVYQEMGKMCRTKKFALEMKKKGDKQFMLVKKGMTTAEIRKQRLDKEIEEIETAVGFSKVIKLITDSEKLVVGHNMLLDVCHIINRFCTPLPRKLSDFKLLVQTLFPMLIDTKYISNSYPFEHRFQSTALCNLIHEIRKEPFGIPNFSCVSDECEYKLEDNKNHEAGYDAFITGLIFISLTDYLRRSTAGYPAWSSLLSRYANRIFLMKLFDHPYINLKGEEPVPKRDHVFHIAFPSKWGKFEIIGLFRPIADDVYISFIDSTSAWVALKDPSKASAVVNALIEKEKKVPPGMRKPYSVMTWKAQKDLLKTIDAAIDCMGFENGQTSGENGALVIKKARHISSEVNIVSSDTPKNDNNGKSPPISGDKTDSSKNLNAGENPIPAKKISSGEKRRLSGENLSPGEMPIPAKKISPGEKRRLSECDDSDNKKVKDDKKKVKDGKRKVKDEEVSAEITAKAAKTTDAWEVPDFE